MRRYVLGMFFCLLLALSGCWVGATFGIIELSDNDDDDAPPTTVLQIQARSSQPEPKHVRIDYTLVDPDSVTMSIQLEWKRSIDPPAAYSACLEWGGALPGPVTSEGTTGLAVSPTGVAHIFLWDAEADIFPAATELVDIRLTPIAGGASVTSPAPILVGNTVPLIQNVSLDKSGGNVVVSFDVVDGESDLVNIFGTFESSSLIPVPVMIVSPTNISGTFTGYSPGVGQSFTWLTETHPELFQNEIPDLEVWLTPTDSETGSAGIWGPAAIDNNIAPLVFLTEPTATPDDTRDIALQVKVFDTESDPVQLRIQWSQTATFPPLPSQELTELPFSISGTVETPDFAIGADELFTPAIVSTHPARKLGLIDGTIDF